MKPGLYVRIEAAGCLCECDAPHFSSSSLDVTVGSFLCSVRRPELGRIYKAKLEEATPMKKKTSKKSQKAKPSVQVTDLKPGRDPKGGKWKLNEFRPKR